MFLKKIDQMQINQMQLTRFTLSHYVTIITN